MPPLKDHPLAIPLLSAGLLLNGACTNNGDGGGDGTEEGGSGANADADQGSAGDGDNDGMNTGADDGADTGGDDLGGIVGQWNIRNLTRTFEYDGDGGDYGTGGYGTGGYGDGDGDGGQYTESIDFPVTYDYGGCLYTYDMRANFQASGKGTFVYYYTAACYPEYDEDYAIALTVAPIPGGGYSLTFPNDAFPELACTGTDTAMQCASLPGADMETSVTMER